MRNHNAGGGGQKAVTSTYHDLLHFLIRGKTTLLRQNFSRKIKTSMGVFFFNDFTILNIKNLKMNSSLRSLVYNEVIWRLFSTFQLEISVYLGRFVWPKNKSISPFVFDLFSTAKLRNRIKMRNCRGKCTFAILDVLVWVWFGGRRISSNK